MLTIPGTPGDAYVPGLPGGTTPLRPATPSDFWNGEARQTQLLLGIINDVEKMKITHWMQYFQTMQALDANATPAIDWPEGTV